MAKKKSEKVLPYSQQDKDRAKEQKALEKKAKIEKALETYKEPVDDYLYKTIKLTTMGEPVPYARARFVRRGKHVGTYNPRTEHMNTLKKELIQQTIVQEERELIDQIIAKGDYTMEVIGDFYIKIPTTTSITNSVAMEKKVLRPIVCRGDVDNYIKLILDTLHTVVYDDDKVVVSATANKFYSINPRTELTINIRYKI